MPENNKKSRKLMIVLKSLSLRLLPVKQITGIEPASPAWEAGVLPMNYICEQYFAVSASAFLRAAAHRHDVGLQAVGSAGPQTGGGAWQAAAAAAGTPAAEIPAENTLPRPGTRPLLPAMGGSCENSAETILQLI